MSAPANDRTARVEARARAGLLAALDFATIQQCMHCGMCLPTCPTYDATKLERHSPRGRITLLREIADGRLEVDRPFGEEMYYCLGCLACVTACPAGVDYPTLFETARAEIEAKGVLAAPRRDVVRRAVLRGLFTRPRLLRLAGRLLWLWRASGARWVFRALRLNRLLPAYWRGLEAQTPDGRARFSHQLIAAVERPPGSAPAPTHRVALLTGCVQDILLSEINRDTADVLLAAGCEVHTPPVQPCCGSLHAHNGDVETARALARRQLDLIDPDRFDAIVSNAGGCGSHLRHYGKLLADDPAYCERARRWDAKLRDVHEWLAEIGWQPPPLPGPATAGGVTYHDSCHLCHGQKVSAQPRALLRAACGAAYRELVEASWCCGSAGIYNLTHPATSADLLRRKMGHVRATGASTVATGNPGCHLQLQHGARTHAMGVAVVHPITLLARAVRTAATAAATNGNDSAG